LTTQKPSPAQKTIRQIWNVLEEHASVRHGSKIQCLAAAGSLEDAIATAHDVLVNGGSPSKQFSRADEMWVIFVARSSFLIRQIDTRFYEDKYNQKKHREFLVHTSAYIGKADHAENDVGSPVTLALIPLGRPDADWVGVSFVCDTICGRQIGSTTPTLLDAALPETSANSFSQYFCTGTGFQVTR
jgi:hypothetical protein